MSDSVDSIPAARPAFGVGIATCVAGDGTVLDVRYPRLGLGWDNDVTHRLEVASAGHHTVSTDIAESFLGLLLTHLVGPDSLREVTRETVVTLIADLNEPPVDVHDAYLRLHLLSTRTVAPRSINLDGLFGVLNNVVWTNYGPCAVQGFEATRLRLQQHGPVSVHGIDKFPRMVDYVVPTGVRIADANRVRLGAHLADGTTVMHEGFVNFNAGTLGTSMVEGRISAGVAVGDGSDIGGGASIMGTLSGGGTEVVSIAERCLVGANAGVGISLGDDCVVEAGLYVTAGTKVTLPDGDTVKAKELSGLPNFLYRRNSMTGAVEALPRTGSWGGLNAVLHAND